VCRSFVDADTADEQLCSLNARILPWLTKTGATSELEPWEAAALAQPMGRLDKQTRINGAWLSEGLVVLAWALGRHELPSHDTCVDPKEVTNALEFLQPTAATLLSRVSLRSEDEIQCGADRAFAVHWRLVEFSVSHKHMNFTSFAKTAWFGPLDTAGVTLVESDLAIDGVPLARASADAVRKASGIALERHRAFNWLHGYGEVYSRVETNT
jgi:hypothetical protein